MPIPRQLHFPGNLTDNGSRVYKFLIITSTFQLSLIRTRQILFALTFHVILPVRSRIQPFLYHNLIGHKIPQVQQYDFSSRSTIQSSSRSTRSSSSSKDRAAPTQSTITIVSSSRSKAAAVITGIRCYYSSIYHAGTWYVLGTA